MSEAIKKVIIAEDHNLVRRGLRTLLEIRPQLKIVAETSTGREALEAARETNPDLAIVDYSLPELNGRDLTIELRRMLPDIGVLIYTMHDREDVIVDAYEAGARGLVVKSDSERHLLAAIDAVSRGQLYFSGTNSETLLSQFTRTGQTRPSTLTHREREVVQLIAEGKINKHVARILKISAKTVESHRASAMQKLKLKTSAELVRYAVRNNIIEA